MKFISWNVNGLRACVGKGFLDFFQTADADFFCLQETKMQPGQLELDLPGYRQYWNSAEKKGYSGTAIFSKHEPVSVTYGLPQDEHNHEGRVITLEMQNFYLVLIPQIIWCLVFVFEFIVYVEHFPFRELLQKEFVLCLFFCVNCIILLILLLSPLFQHSK
jgi:hypothetical protein